MVAGLVVEAPGGYALTHKGQMGRQNGQACQATTGRWVSGQMGVWWLAPSQETGQWEEGCDPSGCSILVHLGPSWSILVHLLLATSLLPRPLPPGVVAHLRR